MRHAKPTVPKEPHPNDMETLEQEKAEQRDSLSTQLGQLVAAYIEQHPGSEDNTLGPDDCKAHGP